ncbi:glycoside hydrolase [Thozetella sp. PMI_491]|nr:glycoside hydrolase [Thozetella sp. PMI_491]
MRYAPALAASALVSSASAATNYLGFNSGATKADRTAKFQEDFEAEFKTAQGLEGAPGTFNAVRLYTNIQAYSDSDPISAFEAAINTKTYMLLGIWTSGTTSIDKELTALTTAITKYGSDFTDLVIGMSIGSEDLYRISVTGIANDPTGVGNSPANIVNFINDYKKAVAGTALSSVPIGHVDTWDVWGNASNKAVLDAVDWVGVDEYPYYENGKGNTIKNAGNLFDTAYNNVVNTVGGKPVWVTETGWPVTGPDWDQAVPSAENAKYYWDEIGCRKLFNKVNTFWYNLRDSNPDNKAKFAITTNLSTTPNFNLTCPTTFDTVDTTSSASPSATSSSGSSAATGVSATTSLNPSGTSAAASSTTTKPNAAPSVAMLSTAGYAIIGLMVGAFALL